MSDSLLAGDPGHNTPDVDPSKDYLADLVGEGKKFKTAADLARGKYEADAFIETLKRQQDELRSDYLKLREDAAARAKLEELIDRFESGQKTPDPTNPPEKRVDTPTFKPEELDSLLSKKLLEHDTNKKERENFQNVQDRLKETFGEDYHRSLRNRINELGITEDYVNEQARKYPKALLRVLGVEGSDLPTRQNFQTPPASTVRSDTFKPTTEKRTWQWYQNLKKSDPKRYFDPKTNIQMHNDAIALGDAFKDGDYNAFG